MERDDMRLSAILLVSFLILTVFSIYLVIYTYQKPSNISEAPFAHFYQTADYSYVASLKPNSLYNTTLYSSENATLFQSLVNSMNITFHYRLDSNITSDISIRENDSVLLSTSAWSKTLNVSVPMQLTKNNANYATLAKGFFLNMTSIQKLVNLIETQTAFTPQGYTLQIIPEINCNVSFNGYTYPLNFRPLLNMTVQRGLVSISSLTVSQSTNIPLGYGKNTFPRYNLLYSYSLLGVSVLGTSASSLYLMKKRRVSTDVEKVINSLVGPYREAIADVEAIPQYKVTIDLSEWKDIVNVADTLGKPILHYTYENEERHLFFVLDGEIMYRFIFAV